MRVIRLKMATQNKLITRWLLFHMLYLNWIEFSGVQQIQQVNEKQLVTSKLYTLAVSNYDERAH